jgi:hypothetical protein
MPLTNFRVSTEIGIFWSAACSWAEDPGSSPGMVVMADMQLSDFKSYEFAPQGSMLLMLIEHVNDAFLRRAFRFVVSSRHPRCSMNMHDASARRFFERGGCSQACVCVCVCGARARSCAGAAS